jgi:hypothetical protein
MSVQEFRMNAEYLGDMLNPTRRNIPLACFPCRPSNYVLFPRKQSLRTSSTPPVSHLHIPLHLSSLPVLIFPRLSHPFRAHATSSPLHAPFADADAGRPLPGNEDLTGALPLVASYALPTSHGKKRFRG